jgi:hypothetical protein
MWAPPLITASEEKLDASIGGALIFEPIPERFRHFLDIPRRDPQKNLSRRRDSYHY